MKLFCIEENVSHVLSPGFKETAYAYAISAAGVVSQVARACSMGKLESCGCQPHLDHKTNTWKWKGCNHNVEFGHNFARKFLDFKEGAKDLHSHMNLHNNRAGRLVSITIVYQPGILQDMLLRYILRISIQVLLQVLFICFESMYLAECLIFYSNRFYCL